VSFSPASFGFRDPVVVYDYFAKNAHRIGAGGTYRDTLGATGRAFYVVAPVGASGIALLGDVGKFVGTGRQRLAAAHDVLGRLTTTVLFAPGETAVTLHGYAAAAPKVAASGSAAGPVAYGPATGHFAVAISAGSGAARQVRVVLRTR